MKRPQTATPPVLSGEPQPLISPKLRLSIGSQVVAIHLLVIFGPLGLILFENWRNPQESAFKVKLIGPLSTGPEVGPPERLRPTANPGPLPPADEPDIPAPQPPEPTPQPEIPVVKPKPTPQPKPVVKPKPQPKPVAKPKPKPVAKPKPQPTKPKNTGPVRPSTVAEAQKGVYRPPDRNTAFGDGGGTNTNSAVPIGSRDLAQVYGKQNNGTPGGGADGEDKAYWARLTNYVKMRWVEPPGSLLGDERPEVVIQLGIAADGRVTDARIVKASGNRSMDESVQRMLNNLDRVPTPGKGATSIQMILRTQDS